MKSGNRSFFSLAILLFLAAGCARHEIATTPEPALPQEGEQALMRVISGSRAAPISVKGIGALKLQSASGLRSVRMAWIVAGDGRLRIQILGPGGQPVLSLATDGHQTSGVVHGQDRFFQRATADPDLERIVGIAIKTSQMASLLMGRVPAVDFQEIEALPADAGQAQKYALKRWWRTRQIITLASSGTVMRVENFDFDGDLEFAAAFEKTRDINGYRLPWVLTVTGQNGARLQLAVSRCWVDLALDPELFVIQKPDPGH